MEEDRKSNRKDSWPFKRFSSFLRSGAVTAAQKHFLGGEIKIHLASLRLWESRVGDGRKAKFAINVLAEMNAGNERVLGRRTQDLSFFNNISYCRSNFDVEFSTSISRDDNIDIEKSRNLIFWSTRKLGILRDLKTFGNIFFLSFLFFFIILRIRILINLTIFQNRVNRSITFLPERN